MVGKSAFITLSIVVRYSSAISHTVYRRSYKKTANTMIVARLTVFDNSADASEFFDVLIIEIMVRIPSREMYFFENDDNVFLNVLIKKFDIELEEIFFAEDTIESASLFFDGIRSLASSGSWSKAF